MSQFAFTTGRARPRAASLLAAGFAALALVLAAACDDDDGTGSGRTVARVAVTASAATLEAGKTLQLVAVAYDRRNRALTGKTFSWASSSDALATVAQDGTVTGRAAGPVTISAASEGVTGTLALTISAAPQPVATRVAVVPSFATVDAGGTSTLRAAALAANGDTVRGAAFTWTATPQAAATVSTAGVVTGVAPGLALVVARAGTLADSAAVAVLGPRTLLSTAFPGSSIRTSVAAGQTFTVPVVLDLSKVGSNGDLGSAQFDLVFDPAVLQYVSAASTLQGAAETNLVSAGRVRFAFAGTSVQGSPRPTLTTLTFRVAAGAAAGTQTLLNLVYTVAPTNTSFVAYEIPLAVGGVVRVAAP
ncbi:MAG: Ig-like domain-containing protein [Longimicrobiaceae bacterium]